MEQHTQEAASTQHSSAANAGTSATPDKDSEEDTEETFCTETSGTEDGEALDRAGLDGRLVKEEEEWNADEEAGVTTLLVEDAPRMESMPVPHNTLHAPAPSHTLAAPGVLDEEEVPLQTVPHAENTSPTRCRTLLE